MKTDETNAIANYTQLYRDLYRDNYVAIQYNFVQFFVEHLADVSRVFGADLQSVLILAIVGQNDLQVRIRAGMTGDGALPGEGLSGRTNASSIADICGIPRETVRRKLDAMAKRGWLSRDDAGLWHIAIDGAKMVPVRRELIELDQRGAERTARLFGQAHALAVENAKKKKL